MIYRLMALALMSVFIMGQTPTPTQSVFDAPLQLHRGPAGPYEVVITVQPHKPRVGTVHIAVTVLDPAKRIAVEDAKVLIVAYNPKGEPTYQSPALNDPATPIHYKGNIIFRSPGQWELLVKIETDEHGEVTATTPLNIADAASNPGIEGLIVLALVTLALGGGTAYVIYSIRRQQRRNTA